MKMKKLVALITASALCLGMSMTALADNSLTEDNIDQSKVPGWRLPWYVTNANPNGDYTVEMDPLVEGTLDEIIAKYVDKYKAAYPDTELTDEEIKASFTEDQRKQILDEVQAVVDVFSDGKGNQKRLDIFKKNGYIIPDQDTEVVVLATANLSAHWDWEDGDEMSDEEFQTRFPNGLTQQIDVGSLVGDPNDLGIGDTIYVLHYNVNTGAWETIPAEVKSVGGNAWIEVTFHSLSPIGIVKVMSNNKVIALDKAGNPIKDDKGNVTVLNKGTTTSKDATNKNATNATVSTLGKSPKTGEF